MGKTINKKDLIKFIRDNNKGRFFNVQFVKKSTGKPRSMTAKLGVKYKRKTTRQSNYNPEDRGIMPVYDIVNKGYRSFDVETVQTVTINKETYLVE